MLRIAFSGFSPLALFLGLFLLCGPVIALAEILGAKCMAPVIRNAQYDYVSNLPNTSNDTQDIAAALGRIHFDVTELYDLDYRHMRLALRDFSDKAAGADVVLVYFAGHGIEIDNTNCLIASNAKLRNDSHRLGQHDPQRSIHARISSVSTVRAISRIVTFPAQPTLPSKKLATKPVAGQPNDPPVYQEIAY